MSKKRRSRNDYINFPIELVKGFLDADENRYKFILYSMLAWDIGTRAGNGEDHIEFLKLLGWEAQEKQIIEMAIKLKQKVKSGAYTGLSVNVWTDYLDHPKTEKERLYLLATLAAKSIIGKDAYKRITSLYWFSRMDGKIKAVDFIGELSQELQKYYSNYYFQVIRDELEDHWGLEWESSRGWYFSFKLDYEKLCEAVKKQKMKNKIKYNAKQLRKKEIKAKINEKYR